MLGEPAFWYVVGVFSGLVWGFMLGVAWHIDRKKRADER